MAQTVQSGTTLDQLPPATGLIGTELFWIYQQGPTQVTPWIGLSCTLDLIADFLSGGSVTTVATMRQLIAAMAANSTLVGVFESLPSDIDSPYNIAWYHANRMLLTDPFITGFLQPTLGYDDAQMAVLYASALTFPA